MTDWLEMTEIQRGDENEVAYGECADLLRRAQAAYPDCDLAEYRRYVAECLQADVAENLRIIKRAKRTRATRLEKRSAERAETANFRLALQLGMIYDVEV